MKKRSVSINQQKPPQYLKATPYFLPVNHNFKPLKVLDNSNEKIK